jgi:type IV secretory pathway VirB2 component (pilin)
MINTEERDNPRSCPELQATSDPQNRKPTPSTSVRPWLALLGLLAIGAIAAPDLWAGGVGSTMPWNTPMQALLNNMTGPTARALIAIATAFSGYKWMFQSHEQGANNMARVTVGGAIALTAQTIISYASFGGALL